jgi:hypothetical protein
MIRIVIVRFILSWAHYISNSSRNVEIRRGANWAGKTAEFIPVALICVLYALFPFQRFHHLVDVSQASLSFWV